MSTMFTSLVDDIERIETNITPSTTITTEERKEVLVENLRLPSSTLTKFQTFLKAADFKESIINPLTRIDKKLSLEIFTMLPDLDQKTDAAKLTNAPTESNKHIVEDIFKRATTDISYNIDEHSSKVEMAIDILKYDTKLEETILLLEDFQTRNKDKLFRLKEGIDVYLVIFGNTIFNLYTDTFDRLSDIDDAMISYGKYKGKITSYIYNIRQEKDFIEEICKVINYSGCNCDELRLSDIVEIFNKLCIRLKDSKKEFTSFYSTYYDKAYKNEKTTKENVELHVKVEMIVEEYSVLAKIADCLTKPHSVLSLTEEFISVL